MCSTPIRDGTLPPTSSAKCAIRSERCLDALILATVIVMILYVCLNAVFLASGPMQEFAGKIAVGEIAARNLLGAKVGGLWPG